MKIPHNNNKIGNWSGVGTTEKRIKFLVINYLFLNRQVVGKKEIKFAIGAAITTGLLLVSDAVLNETAKINLENCIYEINYPDGTGNTIKAQSSGYVESYFIDGVHQDKYYFVPLNEIDTIFFVGNGQSWNMKRLSCN